QPVAVAPTEHVAQAAHAAPTLSEPTVPTARTVPAPTEHPVPSSNDPAKHVASAEPTPHVGPATPLSNAHVTPEPSAPITPAKQPSPTERVASAQQPSPTEPAAPSSHDLAERYAIAERLMHTDR